jgi:arsenite methyltransferase
MTDDSSTVATEEETPAPAEQRTAVRERYGRIAEESACCSDTALREETAADYADRLGYSEADREAVDGAADLGLGCGNPTAIADLAEGDTVLDLGSGGGFDCFLAAGELGPTGRVIGVDMTPEMVETARENAEANDASNVEFRLGEIEHLPVADGSIDVILSNCVVNLSPEKPQVFEEAYRVLRPGGRLAISDIVLTAELPADRRTDLSSITSCVGGASTVSALETMLAEAGFIDIAIDPKAESESFIREWDDDRDLTDYILAATIEAEKPTTEGRR